MKNQEIYIYGNVSESGLCKMISVAADNGPSQYD
jgi:hypothetical protein